MSFELLCNRIFCRHVLSAVADSIVCGQCIDIEKTLISPIYKRNDIYSSSLVILSNSFQDYSLEKRVDYC